MNGALGMAGIALGLAASLLGAFTLVLAAVQHRPRLVRSGVLYVWLVLGGAVLAVVAMERALITRDFSLALRRRGGLDPHTPRSTTWPACGARSTARSSCGR